MNTPRPTLAVGAIVHDGDGRLLVVRRGRAPAAGRWTLPGGRVDPGESVSEALRREVAEETGLDVEVGELVGFVEVRGDDHHYVILDLAATVRGGRLRAGDDATAANWMTRTELAEVPTTDGLLEFLDAHDVAPPP